MEEQPVSLRPAHFSLIGHCDGGAKGKEALPTPMNPRAERTSFTLSSIKSRPGPGRLIGIDLSPTRTANPPGFRRSRRSILRDRAPVRSRARPADCGRDRSPRRLGPGPARRGGGAGRARRGRGRRPGAIRGGTNRRTAAPRGPGSRARQTPRRGPGHRAGMIPALGMIPTAGAPCQGSRRGKGRGPGIQRTGKRTGGQPRHDRRAAAKQWFAGSVRRFAARAMRDGKNPQERIGPPDLPWLDVPAILVPARRPPITDPVRDATGSGQETSRFRGQSHFAMPPLPASGALLVRAPGPRPTPTTGPHGGQPPDQESRLAAGSARPSRPSRARASASPGHSASTSAQSRASSDGSPRSAARAARLRRVRCP